MIYLPEKQRIAVVAPWLMLVYLSCCLSRCKSNEEFLIIIPLKNDVFEDQYVARL